MTINLLIHKLTQAYQNMKNNFLSFAIGLFSFFSTFPLFCAETSPFSPITERAAPCPLPKIIRVKWDATGANNGTSWIDAYKELTDALTNAVSGDQIWVTGGDYFPTRGTDRSASFALKSGVAIYGRFLGVENSPQERNLISGRVTQLTGNIGNGSSEADNSYHVIKGENITNVVIDNVFVTAGNANGSAPNDKKGGGFYLSFSGNGIYTLDLNKIYTYQCQANTEGGGVFISSTNKADCRLKINEVSANLSQANLGGGFFCDLDNAKCVIQSRLLISNTSKAGESGGGMYIRNARNSTFEWVDSLTQITNCVSLVKGGGLVLLSSDNSTAKIVWTKSALAVNTSEKGGGAFIESTNGSDNSLTFNDSDFDVNSATGANCEGGCFSNHATSGKSILRFRDCFPLDRCALKSTSIVSGKGGFMYNTGVKGLSGAEFINSDIFDNKSTVGSGGFIYNDDNEARISFLKCPIRKHSVGQDGGFAYMNGGHLSIDSCWFFLSNAGRTGGAIYFQANSGQHDLVIKNTEFDSLTATNSSAIHIVASGTATITPFIYKTIFTNTLNSNTTTFNAPFSFQTVGSTAKIANGKVINCLFRGGKGYVGSVVHDVNGGLCDMTYVNCLFYRNKGAVASIANKAANTEGVLKPIFANTMLWEHGNLTGGQGRTVVNLNETTPIAAPKPQPTFINCLLPESNCTALDQSYCNSNVMGQDPLLIDNGYNNFDLFPCSPAINAGFNAFLPTDLTKTLDYRANLMGYAPRIWQSIVDIGITEYTGENHLFSKILDAPNRTVSADRAYQDAEGWTHFYNCAEKTLLLSVKNGADNIGKLTDSLKVSVTTTPEYGLKANKLRNPDYLNNPTCDKWFVMNRYWKLSGARTIGRNMDVRFYFTPKDSADLQKAIPFNAYQDMRTYQVTKALAHDAAVRSVGGAFTPQSKDAAPALTKWALTYNANYRTAQYQTGALNSSGSAGVLVPAGSTITQIDTLLCWYQIMKIRNQELPNAEGNFTVTLKTIEGCDSIVKVRVRYEPRVSIGPSDITPDNAYKSGRIVTYIVPTFVFRWSNGDSSYFIKNLKAGTYRLTVTSYEHCYDTITYQVPLVKPFEIPNAFTPNEDGLNDFFTPITYGNPKIIAFKIYNRTGTLVYDNDTPDKGWNGQYKGQEAASDVYVYSVLLDFGNGHILRGSGEVNLMR
jgi:gliding motility-associated-like protein